MAANYRKVGERIQNARAMRGITIGELANRVHFTPKSIALVESGQAEFNISLLTAICTALDVTPNDLLEGEYQTSGGSRSLEEESLLSEMRALLAELRGEEDDGTVLRDSESVIREIRDMLREEKQEKAAQPSGRIGVTRQKEPDKKSGRAHYF